MSKPPVSVIMSEYNTPLDHLMQSIESILNQTFVDFEFVIIDDSGEGRMSRIVERLDDPRIRVIENAKNMGLVYSLNRAIEESRGVYLIRMDTDDIAYPSRIEELYDFILKHPEYDVVGSRAMEFSEGSECGVLGEEGEKTKRSIMRGDSLIHPSVIMKKDSIEMVGLYADYYRAEDLALWCSLLMRGSRLYVIGSILLKYRVDIDDYRKRKLSNRKGEIRARLHYYPKLGAGPVEYLKIIRSIVAGVLPYGIVQKYRKRFVLRRRDE